MTSALSGHTSINHINGTLIVTAQQRWSGQREPGLLHADAEVAPCLAAATAARNSASVELEAAID